ncbi:MAG: nucleotidyltransferase domain-containing protein [Planctomycetes bacterium]|nr:nucleotidyltransferase domain-containing protein [Planctomycetota bacterium]
MTAVIEQHLRNIEDLCHRLGVRRLAVFGSGVRGDFDDTTSDIDFLVEFVPMSPREHKESYFLLLEGLEGLLSRPVDLVEVQALTNPFVRSRIEAEQETVYDAA